MTPANGVAVSHIGITVANLERSVEFYRRLFGIDPALIFAIDQGPEKAAALGLPEHRQRVAILPVGPVFLELLEITPSRRENDSRQDDVGYTYVSFSVEDLDAFHARLAAMGVQFNSGPLTSSEQDPVAGSKFCIMKDPDGKNIELVEFGPGMRAEALHTAAAEGRASFEHPIVLGHASRSS